MRTSTPSDHASATFEVAGRTVHRLGFGAMRLVSPDIWGPPTDRAASIRVARTAVELGVDFVDTADAYGLGANEEILREALHPYPEHVLIATKAGQAQVAPRVWEPVGRPAYLRQQCELSLRRLGVDRIDLYYLHRVDPEVPFADQVGTLAGLRAEGKIAHVGLCEVTVEQLEQARTIVDVAAVQSIHNLTTRPWESVIDHCTREGIAFVPWYPVGSGALAAPGGVAEQVGRETAATPAQVALAWLLARSPAVLPIPGTSSPAHLAENVRAAQVRLDADQLARLTASGPG